jgi:hypothetical protein
MPPVRVNSRSICLALAVCTLAEPVPVTDATLNE